MAVTTLHHDLAERMTSVFADQRPDFVQRYGEVTHDAHHRSLGNDVEGDEGAPGEQLKGVNITMSVTTRFQQ